MKKLYSKCRAQKNSELNFINYKLFIFTIVVWFCTALGLLQTVSAAPGGLDPTFSGDGKLTDFFAGNGNDYSNKIAVQPDGKIVAAGFSDQGFEQTCSLARFNGDGSLDTTFAGTGKILAAQVDSGITNCRAVAIQADGKIVAAGYIFDGDNNGDFIVFRFNSNGSPDTSFGTAGRVRTSVAETMQEGANAVAVQADGKIVAAGFTNNLSASQPADFALVRYNADGSLDTTFDADGKVVTPMMAGASGANAVVIQPDGKIVAGGSANSTFVTLMSDFAVVRYNTDGSLDTSFDADGKAVTQIGSAATIYDIALQPDGKIVAAGESYSSNSSYNFTLARYNADGSLDNTFGGAGTVITGVLTNGDGARAVAIQADGKIVAAGYGFRGSTLYDFVLVRYSSNGVRDSSFGANGIVTNQFTKSDYGDNFDVAVQPDGRIVGSGSPYNGTDTDFTLFRYNTNGSLDTTFDTDGYASADIGEGYAVAQSVAVQPDGKIIAAGYTFNGTDTDFALIRYNPDGSLDTSFGTGGKVTTPVLNGGDYIQAVALQPDGKIIVAGSAQGASSSVFALARYNTNGSLDTSFDTDGKVTTVFTGSAIFGAKAVAIQTDGKIVAAGTVTVGSNTDFALARYNADGSLDSSFDTDGKLTTPVLSSYDYANAVAVQADGKIVAAGYTDAGSFNYDFALVRYNANGSLDTAFDADGKVTTPILSGEDEANAVTIQTDGKIVTAGYADNGTDFDFALARYNANGSLDASFDIDGKLTTPVFIDEDVARAVAVQADGKIIAAGYAVTGTQEDFALVRYNANGSIDTAYGAGGKVIFDFGAKSDSIYGIALDSLGRAVAAGNAGGRFAAARITGDSATNAHTPFDFDGDGKADVSVFRPSDGNWYAMRSQTGFSAANWGISGDKPAPADYDGDGKTDYAVFRENGFGDPNKSYFFILKSMDNTVQSEQFGRVGDDPSAAGDWDGDGKADAAVFRGGANMGEASYFYYHPSSQPATAFVSVSWGISGDKPVIGDYDGDGKLDAAVFRPSNAVWYVQRSSDKAFQANAWGLSTDKPVARDFDGDGKTDLTVFRDGNWYILQSSTNQFQAIGWGLSTDTLVPADYDGDGKTDAATYRNGVWYVLRSSDSQPAIINFGLGTDTPLPSIR